MSVTTENPLRAARRQRGLSQGELMKRSGVHAVTISLYEQGKRLVKMEHLRAISKALDTPMMELLEPRQAVTAFTVDDAAEVLGVDTANLTCLGTMTPEAVATWLAEDPSRIEVLNELAAASS